MTDCKPKPTPCEIDANKIRYMYADSTYQLSDSSRRLYREIVGTVVPVMNGHPRDQAKVSVHCRWPLVTGTDGQAGDAKYNTPCNTT